MTLLLGLVLIPVLLNAQGTSLRVRVLRLDSPGSVGRECRR